MLPLFIILIASTRSSQTSLDPLSYDCRLGTRAECQASSFVPGHTLLGEGINIVTMRKTGASLLDMQDYEKENETCTLCNNPFNSRILQKLPKSMVDWKPQTSCTRNIASSIAQSKISLAKTATSSVQNDWKVGLDLTYKGVKGEVALGGSHSKMAAFAESKTLTDKYSFVSHELSCAFYRFRTSHNPQLTEHFYKSLRQLPNSYDNSTKDRYRRLIYNYGTHYVIQAEVGGRALEVTALRSCQLALEGLTLDQVKDCLSVESKISAGIPVNDASISGEVRMCKEIAKQAKRGSNFHQTFNERIWEGGSKASKAFSQWMESLKKVPDLLSYSLEPIHELVRFSGPQKENLRLAISDYIKEKSLTMRCSCPQHGHQSQQGDCSCICPVGKYMNSDCCPTNQGTAKVELIIQNAMGLSSEVFSKADGYVKFMYEDSVERSPTVWNNNNPTWNFRVDLGFLQLGVSKKYTIEVWDENKIFPDKLLGRCEKLLTSGSSAETCYLNHGSLKYSINVACSIHLQGLYCQDYRPQPPK
ncbi:hypothetical protein GDO86_019294 [Hymenochirus boettgeri]|uniref:Perforin-1-like n=1 Tax=Hymenochirus boettgeri TaxID=247094 RepID=A0A8T2IM07_9PIPI|nr:hypothetical protein GDO86_019294 [Hymenochirus boettgeri]